MTPILVAASFYLLVGLLCWWRPNAGRLFLGIFFLLMAFGVNLTIILTQPHLFPQIGAASFVPFIRWFCATVVAWNPVLFGLVLLTYETVTGLLLLGKGRQVRAGIIMALIFLIGITPVGVEELPNPILALVFVYLYRKEFPVSLVDMVRGRFAGQHQPLR